MIVKRNNIQQREYSKNRKRGNGITQADIDKAIDKRNKKNATKNKPTTPQVPTENISSNQVIPKESPKPSNVPNTEVRSQTPPTNNPKPNGGSTTGITKVENTIKETTQKKGKGLLSRMTKGQKIAGGIALGTTAAGGALYAYNKHKNKNENLKK